MVKTNKPKTWCILHHFTATMLILFSILKNTIYIGCYLFPHSGLTMWQLLRNLQLHAIATGKQFFRIVGEGYTVIQTVILSERFPFLLKNNSQCLFTKLLVILWDSTCLQHYLKCMVVPFVYLVFRFLFNSMNSMQGQNIWLCFVCTL